MPLPLLHPCVPAAPVLAAFEELPLAMEIRSAMSMGADTGTKDLDVSKAHARRRPCFFLPHCCMQAD